MPHMTRERRLLDALKPGVGGWRGTAGEQ
jgi:hypothetical protein